jgi:DNA-binding MarR family transcriptional regulator
VKDRIDEHVELWSRELPGMDPRVEGIVTRMQALVRHLYRDKERALAAAGLQMWEYQTLLGLRRRGAPYRATPTELAAALELSPAAMTKRLDNMERSGYVRRSHDADDRRRIFVTLTEAGLTAWERTVNQRDRVERELIGELDPDEQDLLVALLRRLVLAAQRTAEGTGGP